MLRRLTLALFTLLLFHSSLADTEHTVQRGDTLSALAREYATSIEAIQERNGLSNDLIRVGQVLVIPEQPGSRDYRMYLGATGDTLVNIAAELALPLPTLRSANPDLEPETDLGGLPVLIPPAAGVTIWVSEGDTLIGLAAAHGVAPSLLATINRLSDDGIIEPGRPILVPIADGVPEAVPEAPALVSAPVADPRVRHRNVQATLLAQAARLLSGLEQVDEVFLYPVAGRLSSGFGWRNISVGGNRFHGGVDIAVDSGSPILASRHGVVIKAGWGGAYGYVVYLDHGDGSQTRYAHLSRIDVGDGATVRQGDPIGLSGSTGASTGPHLHFELRLAGRAVDPQLYLETNLP